jgi:hypothetical protein
MKMKSLNGRDSTLQSGKNSSRKGLVIRINSVINKKWLITEKEKG